MENKSHPTTRSAPVDITFRLLEEVTHGFSEEQKVGSGGYGEVYKGVHNGEEIAIKKLYHMPGLDDVQFKKEFNNLMMVHHQNIIALIGYCYEVRHKHFEHNGEFSFAEMAERALCFEYLEGGSLDKHISDPSSGLDWSTRYKIIKGVCEGVNYLHTGRSKDPIYHMDLKPANILLDKNMTPKIGDFGLSRLFASTATFTTKKMIGTPGYMPPEYINRRQISSKFDVFSLGVIIIQIMAGPQGYSECADVTAEEFVELVHRNWEKRLQPMSWHTSQEVKTCIQIALRCVETDRAKRPTISEIVGDLKRLDTHQVTLSASSESGLACAAIDPLEVRFSFQLHKEASCVLQLTNRTDDTVAFSTKANRDRYYAHPDEGVLPPCSRRYVVVTMRAPDTAPAPGTQCNDVFLVQSTRVRVSGGGDLVATPDDIANKLRKLRTGEVMVDEARLPIVYIALTQPPSPSP